MTVSEIITAVDNFAWGPILIIFSLGCGMLFSIALRFPQTVFIPEWCGIENAKLWHGIIAEDYADELKAYKQVLPDK